MKWVFLLHLLGGWEVQGWRELGRRGGIQHGAAVLQQDPSFLLSWSSDSRASRSLLILLPSTPHPLAKLCSLKTCFSWCMTSVDLP